AANVENASRDGRLDGLVAGLGTRASRCAHGGPEALLPAHALELLLKLGDHTLGGTRTLARNSQGTLAPGQRLLAAALTRGRHGHERHGRDPAFVEPRLHGISLENDLAMALGLAQ